MINEVHKRNKVTGEKQIRKGAKVIVIFFQVYGKSGLLGPKTILAHCVHLTDEEVKVE